MTREIQFFIESASFSDPQGRQGRLPEGAGGLRGGGALQAGDRLGERGQVRVAARAGPQRPVLRLRLRLLEDHRLLLRVLHRRWTRE